VQEILDAAEPAGARANRLHQTAGTRIDAALGRSVASGFGEESRGNWLIRRRERRPEWSEPRVCRRHCRLHAGCAGDRINDARWSK
jgi:hypothetical protein